MPIETCRAVAFSWLCDQNGHLNTSKYVEMFDVAFYHLVHALGAPPGQRDGLGWANVLQALEYRAEVGLGAPVLIRSGIIETGRTSFRSRHVMTDPDQAVVHAILQEKTVRFDLSARRSAPLPEGFVERAKALTGDDWI